VSKKGVPIVFVSCLVLVWLFGGQPANKIDPIPTDGLIEAVANVKDAMGKNSHESHRIDFMTVQPSGNPGQLSNSSESPNSSPSPSDRHEKAKREIIIFTRPNCPPCDRWKRCEQAKFEADGWTVAYCDDHNFAITPYFLIEANGRKCENKGYLPFDKIGEVLK